MYRSSFGLTNQSSDRLRDLFSLRLDFEIRSPIRWSIKKFTCWCHDLVFTEILTLCSNSLIHLSRFFQWICWFMVHVLSVTCSNEAMCIVLHKNCSLLLLASLSVACTFAFLHKKRYFWMYMMWDYLMIYCISTTIRQHRPFLSCCWSFPTFISKQNNYCVIP